MRREPLRRFSSPSDAFVPSLYHFHDGFDASLVDRFTSSFLLTEDFITSEEEQSLLTEAETHLKRIIYEKDHWDEVGG
jgi:hypothetical protein